MSGLRYSPVMTDATFMGPVPRSDSREEAVPLTKPEPFAAPVLIGDCVSPLAGETVLSLLWRRLSAPED